VSSSGGWFCSLTSPPECLTQPQRWLDRENRKQRRIRSAAARGDALCPRSGRVGSLRHGG
jgi:hypothetical protein